ncbi:hypothetical protein ACVWYH_007164 [Bradyrhizobium sp. GM24.11]
MNIPESNHISIDSGIPLHGYKQEAISRPTARKDSSFRSNQAQTSAYVKPGGEILLRLSGWPKVERVLQQIDAVEALGIDPADAAPDYWHHVHNRMSVNENPRPYTKARHQAWLHRQRVMR